MSMVDDDLLKLNLDGITFRNPRTPFLSNMASGFYSVPAQPPIIGYTRTKWTNPFWRRLYRVLNYPLKWVECDSYEECTVTFRPAEWARRHIEVAKPIYDPNWHEVKRLKSSGPPGVYKHISCAWVEVPDYDASVLGVDEHGMIVRSGTSTPADISPLRAEWGQKVTIGDSSHEVEE